MAGLEVKVKAKMDELMRLQKEVDSLKSKLKDMNRAKDPKGFDAMNQKMYESYQRTKTLRNEIETLSPGLLNLQSLLMKIGGTAAFVGLAREIIRTRSEFQQLEIAFSTMLKSEEKAVKLMKDLTTFAAETPFGLDSAASGAKQLIAYGSQAETVIDELTMLGDVAAGTGQQLGDLVYLYGTLRMQGKAYLMDIRQFAGRGIPIYKELANVLKINESQVNEFVSAGKVGFKEVEQAFKNMTAEGGMFGGLMKEQSKAWTGQIEELKDNISVVFNEIGKASEGAFSTTMKGLNLLVANYEKVGKVLVSLIATYGAYRTAVALNAVAEKGWTISQMANYRVLLMVEKAQKLLNATILKNPYVMSATLVMGVVSAMWALRDSTTAAEKAQERYNETKEKISKAEEDHKQKIESLIGTIHDEASANRDRVDALNSLKELYPSIFDKYDVESLKLADILKIKKDIAEIDSLRGVQVLRDEYTKALSERNKLQEEISYRSEAYGSGQYKYGEFYGQTTASLKKRYAEVAAYVSSLSKDLRKEENALWESRTPKDVRIQAINDRIEALKEENRLLEKNKQASALLTDPISEAKINSNKALIRSLREESDAITSSIKNISPGDEIKKATEGIKKLNKEIADLRSGDMKPDQGKNFQQSIDERLKSVKEYQSALETLTGVSEKQSKVEAEAAKGSVAFLNKMIADAKSNFESATTDESRTMYSKLIKDLEDQLKTVQERIALAGADVVTEALQGAIKGVKVVSGAYDTAVKIGGNTVDMSGLKRLVEKNAPSLMDSLFKSADKMAVSSIINLLNQAKEASKKAFDPADAKAYQDAIENLERELRERSPFKAIAADWKSLMAAIGSGDKDGIATAASGLSQGLGNVQGQLEQIAGGIGDIFGEEAGYAASQVTELTGAITGFGQAAAKFMSGDILGGITDVVVSVGKIFSMASRTKEMNEAAKKEVQEYYDTAIKGEREYQALLRQRAREAAEADRKTLESFKNTMDELSKQSNSIQAEYDKVWAALMGEEYVSGRGYKHGTWFRKAKTWDIMSSLQGMSYDDIEKLYTEGKLKDNAKELFEQLRDLKEEGLDVNEMLKDQAEALNEYASGMTFDSLRDSIKDAFSDGRMDIQESADFTRDAFKKAMLQALEAKVLNKALEPFLDSFTKDATEGTLFDKIDYYERWIKQIGDEGNKFMESLTSLPGLSDIFSSSSSSDNSLAGAVSKITHEDAGLIAGQFGAMRVDMNKTAVNTDYIRESMNVMYEVSKQKLAEVKAIRSLADKIEKSNAAIQTTNAQVAKNTDGINSIAQSLKDISTHGLDLK